jgi:signal transduction histidine kinase
MDDLQHPPSSRAARPVGWREQLVRAWRASLRTMRRYADWLAAQSWKRLMLLGLLAIIVTALLSEIPPFSTKWGGGTVIHIPKPPKPPKVLKRGHTGDVEVRIDEHGVRIGPPVAAPSAPGAASGASAASPASGASGASDADDAGDAEETPPTVQVPLPPGADTDAVRHAIEEAKREVQKAIDDAKADGMEEIHVSPFRLGDHLMTITLLLIVASIIAKVMNTGRRKAEAQAAVATERAESESLKRQVMEARMAAMQAQVEPHFLFNTLASIDHLIETDPPRASQMQKNLIALLRASMPTMRETNNAGPRPLERELAVVRPYLEILKVRMEERLQTEIDVPEGLLSAEFPQMMIQSLVENAIKHGLEPKAEGGKLTVKAEVRHGKLAVTVADTGLGFGRAATAGTGVGLANIRERLQMLYGSKASLTVAENRPSGTVVTITVPYTHRDSEGNAA